MENLERQLEEIEVLEAIYPDELTVDAGSIASARQRLEDLREGSGPVVETTNTPPLSFTVCLARLTRLGPNGKPKEFYPSLTVEFPPEYPATSPPLVTKTSGLDAALLAMVPACLEEHAGAECTMQLITVVNEAIQVHNEKTDKEYECAIEQKEQETKSQLNGSSTEDSPPVVLGRRIINSPYILKPAKIKDLKKVANELGLGGYAKVGKPGILVVEGPEEGCRAYCPRLEDRGWKYQKVRGEQRDTVPSGTNLDDRRVFPQSLEILDGEDALSEIVRRCRNAGLADFFFGALNLHDSMGDGKDPRTAAGSGTKEGKR